MKLRKLTWSDVQAKLAWIKNDGQQRVFASLKQCSFVNTTLLCDKPNLESPELRSLILRRLETALVSAARKIDNYRES